MATLKENGVAANSWKTHEHLGTHIDAPNHFIENYSGHKILFKAGKWGVECVANLKKIPKKGATVIVAAPKVGKATGGFTRIIAIW